MILSMCMLKSPSRTMLGDRVDRCVRKAAVTSKVTIWFRGLVNRCNDGMGRSRQITYSRFKGAIDRGRHDKTFHFSQ